MGGRGLEIFPVHGIPEVEPGDILAEVIAEAVRRDGPALADGDVVVVTQKVVAKAEGRVVDLDAGDPAARRRLVEGEAVRVLRRRGELLITETVHGFVCANAGIDLSNVAEGRAALLPTDPDRSARRIRDGLRVQLRVEVGVVVSDTFGRPWRRGATDVAIDFAGVSAVGHLLGRPYAWGLPLEVTEVAVADELASAAELVMGKASGIPVALVRGVDPSWLRESSVRAEVIRPPGEDLFR
ncbi:hypothetical protein BH23ACT1_BH23ACT1_00540 [soil metagenome]